MFRHKILISFFIIFLLGPCLRAEQAPAVFSDELVKQAELGNPISQRKLGICYSEGIGVKEDPKKAVEWYKKAAEQGDAYAQCLLGVCLSKGNGISKNEKEAFKWITKSAEQGDAIGQFNLGTFYLQGIGIPINKERGVFWWTKAAEQENEAQGDHRVASRICRMKLAEMRSNMKP